MKTLLTYLIRGYQYLFSPMLGNHCRFSPSCSEYMHEAIQNHGVIKGLFLGLKRILRCAPWSAGGYDPGPKNHNHKL